MVQRSPVWGRQAHADRRPLLLERGAIVRALHNLFDERCFVEVETAALQISPGNEAHLHAFGTELAEPGKRGRRYLRTSPEFACKKLLAAGESRIVEFARVFRNLERGPLHHPEFTLIEWYRTHSDCGMLMEDCMGVVVRAAEVVNARAFRYRSNHADPFAEPERLSVAEAFARYAGIDLLATLTMQEADVEAFAAAVRAIGLRVAPDDTWGDIFSRALVEKIEPNLGLGRATVLYDYPAIMSALARPKDSDGRLCERFELYVCGVELANGFGELGDPVEQRRRLTAEMAEKERIYAERYPIDEDFIAALEIMPPACGVALGLDRLVMLATGAPHIEHVIWSPVAGL
jgi:lysyl-tRNA synthetase class 2